MVNEMVIRPNMYSIEHNPGALLLCNLVRISTNIDSFHEHQALFKTFMYLREMVQTSSQ